MVKFKHIQTSPGLDVILLVLLAAKLHSFFEKNVGFIPVMRARKLPVMPLRF